MPIYLEPPMHNPAGVDGLGHNRLAALALPPMPKCALRPQQETTFWEAHDTRRAGYHAYGNCDGPAGNCNACPRLNATEPWPFAVDQLTIRVDDDGAPWIMNRPDDGWGEYGIRTTWERLLRIEEAEYQRGHDNHGRLIVMRRTNTR